MKQLTTGLGVKCSHCHEAGDDASDKKPAKLAARKMLKMTRALDKEYFGGKGKLTCKTCHKGKTEPE
jgi:photosynthetic reaction center cytochrome c subunit